MNLYICIPAVSIFVSVMCGSAAYALASLIYALKSRYENRKKARQSKWRH